MKFEEAMLNGEKINVVVDMEDDLIETVFFDKYNDLNLEDTTDLSKTIEIINGEFNE